ncbi:hypothetical protein EIJ81_00090 (plasmid) [Aliivibrio salmonicida]|nr:hypothetical protein [Aliivibrio salmonicida]AZL83306.1 hypothetical protein EIJ81_00090 [Aliivibrio salmonicida]
MAMSMYYIKTGLEYWKPKGYGYTKSREEAGVFTLKDMEELNLDGCTLERAEVAFLDEDGPSPDLPHRVTLPAIERGAGGFQRGTLWHGICVKNGVFVNISDVPVNPRDYCQPLHPGCLGLVESGLMLVKQWFKVVQGWLKLVEKG